MWFLANRVCKKGYRRCVNGRCVGHSSWCNGQDDCGDNSDEVFCNSESGLLIKQVFPACSHITFSNYVLPKHCLLILCLSATLCSADQFQCRDGGCISNSSKCNQKVDCEDASDEMNCSKLKESHSVRISKCNEKSQHFLPGYGIK